MAVLYIAAGVNHFVATEMYLQVMPLWLCCHRFLVYVSGVLETVLGVLLMVNATKRVAAWGLILLLIAIFPANVQMMLNYKEQSHPHFWLTVLRLPLQPLLIWWAWVYTKPQRN